MSNSGSDPTKSRAWRVLRDDVIKHEPICWLQMPGICTRVSTTADHVIPKSQRPDLAMVRTNLRGACLPCNKARNTTPIEALNLGRSSGAADIFGD
ncbi:MAG: HNH endonuclease [Nocardioidaceae bacterium]